jgi:hypothetical protein
MEDLCGPETLRQLRVPLTATSYTSRDLTLVLRSFGPARRYCGRGLEHLDERRSGIGVPFLV